MQKQISPKIISLIFGILVICFLVAFYVLGWTEPTAVPPGGNVPAPINVGDTGQAKLGQLGVGTANYDNTYSLTVGNNTSTLKGIKAESNIANQPAGYFSNPSGYAIITGSGNVGIGTTGPTQKLDVVGYVKGTGLCIGNDCRTSWPSGGLSGKYQCPAGCNGIISNQSSCYTQAQEACTGSGCTSVYLNCDGSCCVRGNPPPSCSCSLIP